MKSRVVFMSAALLAVAVCGCGNGDHGAVDAAPHDAAPPSDAPDAMTPSDAGGHGNVQDFFDPVNGPCVIDGDCANPLSDCRPIGRLRNSPKQCIPRCTTGDDCPFSYTCYQSDSVTLGVDQMKGHCWLSLCGPLAANGDTGGACVRGYDIPGQPTAQTAPGACAPLDDGAFGICEEVGTVAAGGTCDFATQTHGGANCDATSLCIGLSGMPTGTCKAVCDPRAILTAMPTGCTGTTQCLDRSKVVTYADGVTIDHRTIGWCDDITACATLAPNTCPPAAGGMMQGCLPTNPLRATGECSPDAAGLLAIGATCPSMPMSPTQECVAGAACIGGTCRQLCDTGMTPTVTCVPGTTCMPVLWDKGFDGVSPSLDDDKTITWGSCD